MREQGRQKGETEPDTFYPSTQEIEPSPLYTPRLRGTTQEALVGEGLGRVLEVRLAGRRLRTQIYVRPSPALQEIAR